MSFSRQAAQCLPSNPNSNVYSSTHSSAAGFPCVATAVTLRTVPRSTLSHCCFLSYPALQQSKLLAEGLVPSLAMCGKFCFPDLEDAVMARLGMAPFANPRGSSQMLGSSKTKKRIQILLIFTHHIIWALFPLSRPRIQRTQLMGVLLNSGQNNTALYNLITELVEACRFFRFFLKLTGCDVTGCVAISALWWILSGSGNWGRGKAKENLSFFPSFNLNSPVRPQNTTRVCKPSSLRLKGGHG